MDTQEVNAKQETSQSPNFRWNEQFNENFISALSTPLRQKEINTFLKNKNINNREDIDSAINDICNILERAATIAQIPNKNSKIRKQPNKKWFDHDCLIQYSSLRKMGFLLRSNPLDKTLLINYRYHRKKYKKLLNHKKKLYESNFMHKLEHNTNNPAAFWKLLNQHCKNDKEKTILLK